MDPVMGLVGSVVIARWSLGLLKDTGRILMDMDPGIEKARIGCQGNSARGSRRQGGLICTCGGWGPGHYGAIVSLIAQDPEQ